MSATELADVSSFGEENCLSVPLLQVWVGGGVVYIQPCDVGTECCPYVRLPSNNLLICVMHHWYMMDA